METPPRSRSPSPSTSTSSSLSPPVVAIDREPDRVPSMPLRRELSAMDLPYPRLLRAYGDRDDGERKLDVQVVMARPTCMLDDDALLAQLNPPDEWQHVASGSFGSVFTARWLESDVVVKWARPSDAGTDYDAFEEAVMASSLHHPHVVSFYVSSPSAIVMQRMGGGSLALRIRTRPPPDPMKARAWCRQLCSAMLYLHEFDVVHGDLTAENTLFTDDDVLKIGDFGGSHFTMGTFDRFERTRTDRYVPVTALAEPDADLGFDCDRYAAACVMLNVLTWNLDVFEVIYGEFFERRAMAAPDRLAFVVETAASAAESSWELIRALPLTPAAASVLYSFVVRPMAKFLSAEAWEAASARMPASGRAGYKDLIRALE